MNDKRNKIYFVGAGPGDPKLLTLRGKELLEQADVVIHAGSLVNPVILEFARKDTEKYDSSAMTLEDIAKVMLDSYHAGKLVVRLASGDPSIFGTIEEMTDILKEQNIPFEIVPGVSSFTAAAAGLQNTLTVPDMVQTVILTRAEGRTKMPKKEKLEELAKHQATLVFFLSATLVRSVQEKLLTAYPPDTPVAVVYKASWPDERIVRGRLSNLAELVRREKITKTALIFVGNCLDSTGHKSRLYDKTFIHSFRKSPSKS